MAPAPRAHTQPPPPARAHLAATPARLRAKLLRWYEEHARALPWRGQSDPYAIWISETMLQQTRVETVIPYYHRFLARFPNVRALADAEPDEVMRHWAGLGYYTRARNLHAAAKTVARELGGALPGEVAELRKLRGVGRYTAGALASIAFDRRAPCVDGNIMRVLARLLALREDIRAPAQQRTLWETAHALVQCAQPGAVNQALMELGATVCTPREPACPRCPLRAQCHARALGLQAALPVRGAQKAKRRMRAVAAFLQREGRLLMVRRPPRGLLGGLWELPGGEIAAREKLEGALARTLRGCVGLTPRAPQALGVVRHEFTHRSLRLHVFRARVADGRVRRQGFDAHRWCSPAAALKLPLSSLARRALELTCGA